MPKIVIVDDDVAIQMELEEYLIHMAYTVVGTADTGAGAIEMAREMEPDLILMDINLPGEMDGISAALKIKEEMDVAVVFITGFGDPETIERAKRVEPFGYVMKPFDEQEISGVIEIALYKKEMELKLKAAHDELEQRVRERTAELQKANDELAHEIEERTQAEKKLQETKNTLNSILTSATEYAIAATDLRFRILHYNPAAERIFGYKAEEVLGRTVQEMHTREKVAPERFENAIRAVSEHGKYEYEVIDQDSTGKRRFIHSVVMPMSDEKGEATGYILFARDVTKIRELQTQVVRTERLAATGKLAASIAHEINSPLQAITFILNSLKQESGHDKEASDKIDLLKGAFTSIRDTVKNLLDLNRPGKSVRQQTDINRVIEKTITLIRTQLKKNGIELHQALSPRIPNFTASPQQLNHVFLNLFNNSVEAMAGISKSKGGEMGLIGRGEINVKTNLRKSHVVIKVADNGPGIPKEDLEHIFDPFYTRKKTMGLGVGLSVCHEIVESHGGTITVRNGSEGGAVFTIKLPLEGKDLNPKPFSIAALSEKIKKVSE